MTKIYPDSGVELSKFTASHYDRLMNTASFGLYKGFINRAIKNMNIQSDDSVLDMGCGTGRNACLMAKYLSNKGSIMGLDISEIMEKQFNENCKQYPNAKFKKQRIDQEFELNKSFDKILISFVIHGFPHEIRKTVVKNAYKHLKPNGSFMILDFAEFDMAKMPFHHRFIFKKIECKYAFDYIERDWKSILKEYGFSHFEESFYMKNYVRLLKAKRN